MANDLSPRAVPVPLLLGEAAGRVGIPLAGLPDGVIAVMVPRKDTEGAVRVPVDRKGRPGWREADLVAEQPTQAFTPPVELNPRELARFLETRDHRRWCAFPSATSRTGSRVRCGLPMPGLDRPWICSARCAASPSQAKLAPRCWRSSLNIPELSGEAALLAVFPSDAPLRVPDGSRTGTSAWTVYDAAIRTAAYFLQHQRPDSLLTEREVAAHALPDSKSGRRHAGPRLSSWSVSRQATGSPLWSTTFGSAAGSAGASDRLPPTPCEAIPG
jgi:hypothetical protein